MQAIILAGGFGKRLQSVVSEVPKPMAPVQGKPFLAHLLDTLASQGFKEVLLSVHYKASVIQSYFGQSYQGMKLDYVHEPAPLGTGGAMVLALQTLKPKAPVFVLNGDSYLALDYRAMYQAHCGRLSMALVKQADCSRYGRVEVVEGRVTAFQEKGCAGAGYINAGVYVVDPRLFEGFETDRPFSFEADFLRARLAVVAPYAYISGGEFIDIGIPEDFARANTMAVFSEFTLSPILHE